MCIRHKTGEIIGELRFIPIFKPHTLKLYLLRNCTNIIYLVGELFRHLLHNGDGDLIPDITKFRHI